MPRERRRMRAGNERKECSLDRTLFKGLNFLISGACFFCILLAMAQPFFQEIETRISNIEELTFDWNEPYIKNIYTVSENRQCQKGDKSILSIVWPGADHHCYLDNKYTKGSCEYNKWHEKCEEGQ